MLLVKLLEGFSNHNQVSQNLESEMVYLQSNDIEFREYVGRLARLDPKEKEELLEKHNRAIKPILAELQQAIRYLKNTYGL